MAIIQYNYIEYGLRIRETANGFLLDMMEVTYGWDTVAVGVTCILNAYCVQIRCLNWMEEGHCG